MIIKMLKAGNMAVNIHDTRASMGKQVAEDFAAYLKELLKRKDLLKF